MPELLPEDDGDVGAVNDYPILWHLFGIYINEDWPEDYGTVWAAIEDFARREPGRVQPAILEIHELLERGLREEEIEKLLRGLSCNYWPYDESNYYEWLALVAERLVAAIERPTLVSRPDTGHMAGDATGAAKISDDRRQVDGTTFGETQRPQLPELLPEDDGDDGVLSHYPTLAHLFGCYINEDWPDDYGTVLAALDDFIRTDRYLVEPAAAEIRELMGRRLSEGDLERELDRLGCNYWPHDDELNHEEWLAQVAGRIRTAQRD